MAWLPVIALHLLITVVSADESIFLSVGELVEARVLYETRHRWIDVLLCDLGSCSKFALYGSRDDGTLRYTSLTDTDLEGGGGSLRFSNHLNQTGTFSAGEYVFVLQRRQTELAVWLKAHPSRVVTVPIKEGSQRLWVRPKQGPKDTDNNGRVTFSRLVSENSARLSLGDIIEVRVHYESRNRWLDVLMCNTAACSKLSLFGFAPDLSMRYTALTDCNHRGEECSLYRSNRPNATASFSAGEYVFLAQKRPAALSLWPQGHRERSVSVPVKEDSDILLVRARDGPHDRTTKGRVQMSKCGRSTSGPVALVLNGEKTTVDSVPWHAAVFVEIKGQMKNVCGGSLVSTCAIVTAAHCVPKDGDMFVALGKTLSGWDAEDGTYIHKTKIKKINKHPYYKGYVTKLGYDIALLEMETCAELNDKIFPVCLDNSIKPVSSEDVKVAGWGNGTELLLELEFVVLSQLKFEDCFKEMESSGEQVGYVTHDKFCAKSDSNDKGLLQGDSGGGALVQKGHSWFLAGIVSVRLQRPQGGKTGYLFALTDVSQYLDWISAHLASLRNRALQ